MEDKICYDNVVEVNGLSDEVIEEIEKIYDEIESGKHGIVTNKNTNMPVQDTWDNYFHLIKKAEELDEKSGTYGRDESADGYKFGGMIRTGRDGGLQIVRPDGNGGFYTERLGKTKKNDSKQSHLDSFQNIHE